MEEMLFQKDLNLEDRTLYLLSDSQIDQELSKYKLLKKSELERYQMDIKKTIHQLYDKDSTREDALDRLSRYLIEIREEEPENYARVGYLLYDRFAIVTILLQEVNAFSKNLAKGEVDDRSYKRIANVLILFQSVAAYSETTRKHLVISPCILLSEITNAVSTLTLYDLSEIPIFLIPLIKFNSHLPMFQEVENVQAVDRVRAYALSFIGILCQAGEPQIIQKVIEGNMIETCRVSIEVGSELCKVIGFHILETILQDQMGLSDICSNNRLIELMKILEHMVAVLARNQDASPRLLFHIVRCYILLCKDMRGLGLVKESLPQHFTNDFFRKTTEDHPKIRESLDQLLLTVGAH